MLITGIGLSIHSDDCWDSMDYELGSGKLPWEYWEAIEQKTSLNKFRKDNILFDVIKNNLQQLADTSADKVRVFTKIFLEVLL